MPLPTFFVIGAAKSGTSALYSYLRQHPEVHLPLAQEPSWFSFADQELSFTSPDGSVPSINLCVTERSVYQELYADALTSETLGDISPAYLYWPGTAERVAAEVPDARVVAVLRHPVDRAYSAFMHARREDREPSADFRSALNAESVRIADNCGLMWRYRDLGRYAPQLRRWRNVFPPEQILVARYEDLTADPVSFCVRVQEFIGVDRAFLPNTNFRPNVSGVPRNRTFYNLLDSKGPIGRVGRALTPSFALERTKGVQARLRARLVESVPLEPELRAELVLAWRSDVEDLADAIDLDVQSWMEP